MNTPLLDSDRTDRSAGSAGRRSTALRKRPWVLGAAAAAGVLTLAGIAILVGVDDGEAPDVATPPLELSLGEGGDAMMSCLPFDVAILADMSPAFAGTASAVDGDAVTLDVDRWYAGDDSADTVVLASPSASPALIAGFEFEVGEQYLITAAEGTVNYCGYSGIATPELTAAFDAAFPG